MHYSEHVVAPGIRGFVAAIWTLECGGNADSWHDHAAAPDGCIELIRRIQGRSVWHDEQPPLFVAGLAETAAPLRLSGDAQFFAVRLWPWAWNLLAMPRSPALIGRWAAIAADAPVAAIMASPEEAAARLEAAFAGHVLPAIAGATLGANRVADIVAQSGQSPRQVQRWFTREIGVTPRRYLRLLRFGTTLSDLAKSGATLADHAAGGGYADQPHMARDFRKFAGTAASKARQTARGPFLPGVRD